MIHRAARLFFCTLLLGACCGPAANDRGPEADSVAPKKMPIVKPEILLNLKGHPGLNDDKISYSAPQTLEGVLEADPTPGGKHFQGTWLRLSHGDRYVLSYRPMPKYYHLLWKRVRITGRFKSMGGMIQQIYATHFTADKIEAVSGQDIPKDVPVLMPEPPRVNTKEAMVARKDRMNMVEAKVVSIQPAKAEGRSQILLQLSDGTELQILSKAPKIWTPYKGKDVSFLSWVPKEFGTTEPLQLVETRKVCEIEHTRCGMYTMRERRREIERRRERNKTP